MPHPHLPQRSASLDPAGNADTVQPPKDMLGPSLPLRSQGTLLPTPSCQSLENISMTTAVHEFLPPGDYHGLPAVMSLETPQSMLWSAATHVPLDLMAQDNTAFGVPTSYYHPGEFSGFPHNDSSYPHSFNAEYSTRYLALNGPRSQNYLSFTGAQQDDTISEAYPPAVYQIEPPKYPDYMDVSDKEIDNQLIQLHHDYDSRPYDAPHFRVEDNHDYQSPFSDQTRASTPPDESASYSQNTNAEGDNMTDKELPYAQLIYQALMGAPEKTLILRDIYDWFRKHTDKATASETKGWQNSIRHNLSMNGAFEKVDQPFEDRKGFMWRLTEKAIRDGVKSTTRYRTKQPTKRSFRNHHPQPQRQASGSKGGQAARRSAKMRRGHRNAESQSKDPCISRSVPDGFDPTFNGNEAPISYAACPYADGAIDQNHGTKSEDYHGPTPVSYLDFFPTVRMHPAPPLSQDTLPTSDPHMMLDQGPTQRLFTNSPSLSADEPPTPTSLEGWNEDMSIGAPCVFDEYAYRAYAG